MKRLQSLCNFLAGMFSSSAASFFTLAVIWRNVYFVIPGIVMAILCGIIVYNTTKAEKEEEVNKEEKWTFQAEEIVIKHYVLCIFL